MEQGKSRFGLIQDLGAAHWYDRDGQPRHRTNIRGAVKHGLYPSVTSVLKMWPKAALERWKLEQAILAAITLPRKPSEPDDEFAKRVVVDMNEEAKKAAEKGSELHALMSVRLLTGRWPDWAEEKKLLPWCEAYEPWIHENIKHAYISEGVVCNHKLGYAGTVDLVADTAKWGFAVLDFKNQNVRDSGPAFYEDWMFQLEAYSRCVAQLELVGIHEAQVSMKLPMTNPQSLVSLVLNRNEPDPPAHHVWPEDQRPYAWAAFKTCMALWVLYKKYDPLDWVDPSGKGPQQPTLL